MTNEQAYKMHAKNLKEDLREELFDIVTKNPSRTVLGKKIENKDQMRLIKQARARYFDNLHTLKECFLDQHSSVREVAREVFDSE